jgi:hypothetical protein
MAGITIDPVSTLDSRLALVEIDTKDQWFCFRLRLMSHSMSDGSVTERFLLS